MTAATALALERVVHRYCGRELGGHVGVGHVQPLPAECERLVQRRSDLSGEDLGHPIPPYVSGYPLPDGRYALARTVYLTDADCLGAVRTETLLLSPLAQASLSDPLAAAAAFGADPDGPALADELAAYRARRAPAGLTPLRFDPPAPGPLEERLAPLSTWAAPQRALLLEGLCGPLPLAVVASADELALLGALLALFPPGGAWQVGLSGCALSPREWAELVIVPPAARDRFALRAVRERDLALVDPSGATPPANLALSPASERLERLLLDGAWDELQALLAGASPACARPRDLSAHLRLAALRALPVRAPEQQVELANLLRARGAPQAEQAAPFRELLAAPPLHRLPWLINVLRAGWLPYRRAHAGDDAEPAQVEAVLRQALQVGRADLARAFLEDAPGLYPAVAERVEAAALAALEGGAAPVATPAASEALALLALGRARRDPQAAVSLARAVLRQPAGGEPVLLQLLPLLEGAPGAERDAARVAILGAAEAGGYATAAAAALAAFEAQAPGSDLGAGDEALGCALALAATSRLVEPVLLARFASELALGRRLPLDGLLRGARARPEALRAVGGALLRREDLRGRAAWRPLARLRAVASRAGERELAHAARRMLLLLRRDELGPVALLTRARARVERGALHAAWEALAAALGAPLPGEEPRLRAGAGGLDQATPAPAAGDEAGSARTGHLPPGEPDEGQRTGALSEGAAAEAGEDDTGRFTVDTVAAAPVPPGERQPSLPAAPLQELLRALGRRPTPEPALRRMLELLPESAWELELEALVPLLPALEPLTPPLAARLTRSAGRSLARDPQGAARAAGPQAPLVAALQRALVAEPPAPDWPARARAVLHGPGAALLERGALAAAAALQLRALVAHGAALAPGLQDDALAVCRALRDPRAWGALLELGLSGKNPAAALVHPALEALPALEPALAARLAARVQEGGLSLEALAGLAPAPLDRVLAALPDGFSLRLQNGLRELALRLAGREDLAGLEGVAVVLRHLQPRVAPDRPFRQELARALGERLGGRAKGELARALTAFGR